jgi:hypothetical protein
MAMSRKLRHALAPAAVALVAAMPAQAQPSPGCTRLEAQLAAFDRSSADPARAEQIRRFEEAANDQQAEIERQQATARRMGCESNSFFVLFGGQPPHCGPLNAKIQQMRTNLDRMQANLDRLRGDAGPERAAQRRAILVALAQNNCGAQYRAAVAATEPRGSLFDSLFGPGSIFSRGTSLPGWSSPGDTYRTLCVRTCDGYYYPISFATNSSRFAEDERVCQRSCPAAQVMLFSHRNPGEDVSQAVSVSGQLYSTLPNAFRYRQSFDASCSCRQPGESWAHALKNIDDDTIERGDILVNEQRARLLSQPRLDAQGKPIKPDARANVGAEGNTAAAAPTAGQPASPALDAPVKPDPNRRVRAIGPTFIPAR